MSSQTPQRQPLTTKFFADMLNLEVRIQSRNYDFKSIDELVQLYAQAVEYYDSTKDAIKSYFMEKIQIVITTKENLRLIIKKQKDFEQQAASRRTSQLETQELQSINYVIPVINQKVGSARNSVVTLQSDISNEINYRSISGVSSEEDEEDDEVDELPVNTKSKHNSIQQKRYSISKKRLERSKDFTMQIKIENYKKDLMSDLDKMIEEYDMMHNVQDKIIKTSLSNQIKRLNERIAQKKIENFQNQTIETLGIDKAYTRIIDRGTTKAKREDNQSSYQHNPEQNPQHQSQLLDEHHDEFVDNSQSNIALNTV